MHGTTNSAPYDIDWKDAPVYAESWPRTTYACSYCGGHGFIVKGSSTEYMSCCGTVPAMVRRRRAWPIALLVAGLVVPMGVGVAVYYFLAFVLN